MFTDFPTADELHDITKNEKLRSAALLHDKIYKIEAERIMFAIKNASKEFKYSITKNICGNINENTMVYFDAIAALLIDGLLEKGYYVSYSNETRELFVSWENP